MAQLFAWLPSDVLSLFERGGPVFLAIMLLSVLMWSLIALCYSTIWSAHETARPVDCRGHLPLLGAMVKILPMLGLLGTVEGMIDVFYVIASHGGGNIRGMAGGISTALITTMAGLVTSLSGLYFVADLKHRMADPSGIQETG